MRQSPPPAFATPLPEHRTVAILLAVAVLFAMLISQLIWQAMKGQTGPRLSMSEPIARTFARPDIVDRNGRLITTDLEAPSLFADPALVLDVDEVAEKLGSIIPDLDQLQVRSLLADKGRRFIWLRRGLSPRTAQRIHDLGLPGLGFRREQKRSYPLGHAAAHILGSVNIDNHGTSGIERYIDETIGVEAVLGSKPQAKVPLQLSLDIGIQHALADELSRAVRHYAAQGAAGVIMDVANGEILAAASLPDFDPEKPVQGLEPARLDVLRVLSWLVSEPRRLGR